MIYNKIYYSIALLALFLLFKSINSQLTFCVTGDCELNCVAIYPNGSCSRIELCSTSPTWIKCCQFTSSLSAGYYDFKYSTTSQSYACWIYNQYYDGTSNRIIYADCYCNYDPHCGGDNDGNKFEQKSDLITFENKLYQNYPNPFNPTTEIKYNISTEGMVKISIYDVVGNLINVVFNEYQEPGVHSITINSNDLSSGVYFYTIETNNYKESKKMQIVK